MTWREELKILEGQRVMIVGIGNPLRMDDAIGIEIAKRLKEKLTEAVEAKKVSVYSADISPEDCLPVVFAEKPPAVVLIDACDCGREPGEVVLFKGDELPERSPSTHTLPPKVIGELIEKLSGGQVYYLGVQVVETGFGEKVSPPVSAAGETISNFLMELFS